MMRIITLALWAFCAGLSLWGQTLWAASSAWVETSTLQARLVSVQNGVSPGAESLSVGVDIVLEPGWKTYWRSPGEVGLPPELDWSGSTNLAQATLSFPAPTRFDAFGIENFGYDTRVVFPVQLLLSRAGAPLALRLQLTLLVCAEVCIPETLDLALDLPRASGLDPEVGALLSEWAAKVPDAGAPSGLSLDRVGVAAGKLVLSARSETPFVAPDLFPEQGELASFGKPDLRLFDGGTRLWAALPILSQGAGPLSITLTDGARAATFAAEIGAPPPPPAAPGGLWLILGLAFLGGLILNLMPCVLPVLSIKLTSALGKVGQSRARIRAGFLATAAGILVFFWGLAAVLIALKSAGAAVGWGVQFQSPLLLSLVIVILFLFAANLLGLFEILLPQGWNSQMAQAESRGGWAGDFATGAFAALLATPCSAPFLGTAVTYALSRGPLEIIMVFSMLALGLALPYLVIAARPGWIAGLPKPGAWMLWVKRAMAALLGLTALWFLSILLGVGGAWVAGGLVLALLGALVALLRRRRAPLVLAALLAVAMAGPFVLPAGVEAARDQAQWQAFAPQTLSARARTGEVIFVDVTADWCLTCKANKALVLERGEVATALNQVTRMQADWTRPNPEIQRFLADNDRFGIPFNIVFGPGAVSGLVLPEVLSSAAVLAALAQAGRVD